MLVVQESVVSVYTTTSRLFVKDVRSFNNSGEAIRNLDFVGIGHLPTTSQRFRNPIVPLVPLNYSSTSLSFLRGIMSLMAQTPDMNPLATRSPIYLGNLGVVMISGPVPSVLLNGGWHTTWCPQCGIGNLCNYTCRGPLGFWVRLLPQPSDDPLTAPTYVMQYMPNPAIIWHSGTPVVSTGDSPVQWMSPQPTSPSAGSPVRQQMISPTAHNASGNQVRDRSNNNTKATRSRLGFDAENNRTYQRNGNNNNNPRRNGTANPGTSRGGATTAAEPQQENHYGRPFRTNGNYKPMTNKRRFCGFCFRNGELRDFYRGHPLRDSEMKIKCPILLRYVCGICGATGDKAHTESYCPRIDDDDDNEPRQARPNFQAQFAGRRNATGVLVNKPSTSKAAAASRSTRPPTK